MAQGHSVDEYLETIYFLAFPIGEYRPQTTGTPTLSARVAEMLGVSRASAGEMLKRLERDGLVEDRKSTRLNSSHGYISYAVFCLKKKKNISSIHFVLVLRFFSLSLITPALQPSPLAIYCSSSPHFIHLSLYFSIFTYTYMYILL